MYGSLNKRRLLISIWRGQRWSGSGSYASLLALGYRSAGYSSRKQMSAFHPLRPSVCTFWVRSPSFFGQLLLRILPAPLKRYRP